MNGELSAISGSKDKTVRMWNLITKSCERTFTGHRSGVGCLASTSDNKIIVSGSGDFTIRVWNAETGECKHILDGHHDSIKCLGITDDNRFAIAGSHEGKDQLLLWDLTEGTCARKFIGHTHAVMNLEILPRNKHLSKSRGGQSRVLVTSSRDGTIKAWEMASGKLIYSFDFQSQVKYFDAHPTEDGYSVMLVTKSGTVSVLKLYFPKEKTKTEQGIPEISSGPYPVNDERYSAPEATSEDSYCTSCQCCNCCQKCILM